MTTFTTSSRKGELAALYEQMRSIRLFEEALLELFSQGKLSGTTHTCIGQEANAVGVATCLDPDRDVIVSNHRCHGHYLALTGDAFGLLCEVMGRRDGVCGGKGGSQHLCSGNFFSNGILGSTIPVAAGIALAERERGLGGVTVAFLGDGALGQGVVYESLNLAALWRLPILFVVENNFYAQTTPSHLTLAGGIAARAGAFGLETVELDTTDVEEIRDAASPLVSRIRSEGGAAFLVLDTYRFSPHSKGDDYRDEAEIAQARRRDPLLVAGGRLEEALLREIDERTAASIAELILLAEASPPAAAAP